MCAQEPYIKSYFVAKDFPEHPPEDCGLKDDTYKEYVDAHVGREVPRQCISPEALLRGGWTDWRQYCALSPMMNWA